jgi:hypothetical protein
VSFVADYDDWDDGPGDAPQERVFDDGTVVAADDPLPPGFHVSHIEFDEDYDDDGFVTNVTPFIKTISVTPQMAAARRRPLPRTSAPRVWSTLRRSSRNRGRRRRSRAARASPARPSDDSDPPGRAALRRSSRRAETADRARRHRERP